MFGQLTCVPAREKFLLPVWMNMVGQIYSLYYITLLLLFCFVFVGVGIEHSVNFTCCACEALPITLARAQLWPATPHHPRLAFTFGLLDWTEALMLESQVSLNDFCRSLAFRCPLKLQKVSVNYSGVIIANTKYHHIQGFFRISLRGCVT